jgi:hypothetical protein
MIGSGEKVIIILNMLVAYITQAKITEQHVAYASNKHVVNA